MNANFQEWLIVVATALLHFVWQGMVIAAVAAVLLRALRGASAQARYMLSGMALCLCLLLPVIYLIQNAPAQDLVSLAMNDSAPDKNAGAAPSLISENGTGLTHITHSAFAQWKSQWSSLKPLLPYLVGLWMAGVCVLLLRMILGLRWVSQQVQQAKQVSDPIWQAKLQRMANAMGIQQKLRLGISTQLEFPVTAGWWRPIVILPASLVSGMPAELLEALLAHEVAHIKRFDYLMNLLQSLIEVVLFYHPAVWWLSKQIRIEREQIADDLAASLLGEPRRLALALSELERFQFTHPQLAQVAHGGNLMLRIKRLIQADSTVKTAGWKIVLPSLGLGAACLALYAQASVVPPTAPIMILSTAANTIASTVASTVVNKVEDAVDSTVENTAPALIISATPAPVSAAAMTPLVQHKNGKKEPQFALVKPADKHNTFVNSDRKGLAEIEKLRKENKQDFLWFSEQGTSYLIKDPEIVGQANAAYKPMEELGEQMEQHGKKMEVQGAVMEKIGAQMQALSEKQPRLDDKYSAQFDAKMRDYENKVAAFELKMEAAAAKVEKASNAQTRQRALEELSKEQGKFQQLTKEMQKNDQLFQQHHQQLEQSLQPLQAMSKKMEEAAKPMEALGAQMEQLGKKMESLSQQAEKQIWELIQTAKQKGLIEPVNS